MDGQPSLVPAENGLNGKYENEKWGKIGEEYLCKKGGEGEWMNGMLVGMGQKCVPFGREMDESPWPIHNHLASAIWQE